MKETNETNKILCEMRDTQRQHLEEYRRVAAESLEMQRLAVARQQEAVKLSQRAIFAALVLVVCVTLLILYRFLS